MGASDIDDPPNKKIDQNLQRATRATYTRNPGISIIWDALVSYGPVQCLAGYCTGSHSSTSRGLVTHRASRSSVSPKKQRFDGRTGMEQDGVATAKCDGGARLGWVVDATFIVHSSCQQKAAGGASLQPVL